MHIHFVGGYSGNGNIALCIICIHKHNSADVKGELLKLLSTITIKNDVENLDFNYLKIVDHRFCMMRPDWKILLAVIQKADIL